MPDRALQLEDDVQRAVHDVLSEVADRPDLAALASRAFKSLAKLMAENAPALAKAPDLQAAVDEEFLARIVGQALERSPAPSKEHALRLRGKLAFHQQIAEAGGTYGTQQVADLLGIQPDAVRKRAKRGRLLALGHGARAAFPVWQFGDSGLVPHFEEILGELEHEDPIDAVQFFLTRAEELGRTPLEALRTGEDLDQVRRLARQFGRQVAR